MKKVLALVLSLVLVVGVVATLAACGGNEDAQKTDFEYVQEKGELVTEPLDGDIIISSGHSTVYWRGKVVILSEDKSLLCSFFTSSTK